MYQQGADISTAERVSTGGGRIDSRVGVDRGQMYRQQSGCQQVGVSTGGGYINNRVSISTGGGYINGRAGVSTGGGCIDSRAGVDRGWVYQQQGGHIAGGGHIDSRAGISM